MIELILVASATTVATGLGVIPVAMLGERATELRGALLGVAAGVMLIAAIVGLLLPALDEGSAGGVTAGFAAGVAFLLVARHFLEVAPATVTGDGDRTWVLVFLVLLVHSLPEGFAIGTAYASTTEGLGLFIVVAIAIQNVPEGTSTAIPMATAGYGFWAQFWAAVVSSITVHRRTPSIDVSRTTRSSERADAFQLIRRRSSPGTYSRSEWNSLPVWPYAFIRRC